MNSEYKTVRPFFSLHESKTFVCVLKNLSGRILNNFWMYISVKPTAELIPEAGIPAIQAAMAAVPMIKLISQTS